MNNKKNKIVNFMTFLLMLKAAALPFLKTAQFVKNDIVRSVKHDAKIAIAMSLIVFLIFVLGVLTWISLGAGIIIYAIYGTGPVLTAWFYILLFELFSILSFSLLVAVLKNMLKTPESIDRAEELLNIKQK